MVQWLSDKNLRRATSIVMLLSEALSYGDVFSVLEDVGVRWVEPSTRPSCRNKSSTSA